MSSTENSADTTDDRQFPNEVRVGDDTLAFADGVPAHDGSDEESGAARKSGFFARLFHRHRLEDSDAGLDHYAGEEAFLNAASRHGEAAETRLDGGLRSVSSGGGYGDDATRSIDSSSWSALTEQHTRPMPSGAVPASERTGSGMSVTCVRVMSSTENSADTTNTMIAKVCESPQASGERTARTRRTR